MKRANFTLFQPQTWMSKLGQSALAVLFVWCCMGIQTADAQTMLARGAVAKITSTSTCSKYAVETCNDAGPSDDAAVNSPQFVDDGANDGNYADILGMPRTDTIEICGSDAWHRVKVTFTMFDLEDTLAPGTGDTLLAFQGNKAELIAGDALGAGSGTGTGVSKAFGGWIDADCDPKVNASGCLTFIFKTDGDNRKGAGWEAWVDCSARNINLAAVADQSVKLTCDDKPFSLVTITPPAVTACGTTLPTASDSVIVTVTNQAQTECFRDTLSNAAENTVTDTFAIGIYTVKYVLLSDQHVDKTITSQITVQAPNLVCNDDIIIPFGSACMVAVTPDMVLEEPCDTLANDTMQYEIEITVGSKTIKGVAPILTRDLIKEAGMTVCNGTATIKITRTYGNVWNQNGSTICNNGEQSHSCSTDLTFNDASAPIFTSATQSNDTLVACDAAGLADLITLPTAIDNCDSVASSSSIIAPSAS